MLINKTTWDFVFKSFLIVVNLPVVMI